MNGINKHILLGHLGKNPDITEFSDTNKIVANFSVATNDSYKNSKGEAISEIEWHNIECWGNTADFVKNYLSKGDLVYIEGKSKNTSYEKDGITKYKTIIMTNTIRLASKASDRETKSE